MSMGAFAGGLAVNPEPDPLHQQYQNVYCQEISDTEEKELITQNSSQDANDDQDCNQGQPILR